MGKIREAVRELGPGDVVVLRSWFRAEPLIETMRRAGAAVHSSTQARRISPSSEGSENRRGYGNFDERPFW